MLLFHKLIACAFLAAALTQSEAPAQDRDSGANPKAGVPPTLPPVPPSPTDYFRRLLAASPAEREKLLAGRSADQRRVLTNNVRAYLALPPEDRESRLRALELRCHLTPLLQAPASNRVQRLALVPEAYRELVRERLALWDGLAPDLQRQILDNGRVIRFGPPVLPPMPPLPSTTPRGLTSNQLLAADEAVAAWARYPAAKQAEIAAKFSELYDLPPAKKEQAIAPLPLSPAERAQMEQTLEKYRSLPAAQRGLVFKGFKKFAELPAAERHQFLRNAEAWQAMSAEDRQRWRQMVNNVPPMPPLPPGFGTPPLPPMPPVPAPRSNLLTTNYNQ